MIFEEVDWHDGDGGQFLENALFQRQPEENLEITISKKKTRKSKKMPTGQTSILKPDVKEVGCSSAAKALSTKRQKKRKVVKEENNDGIQFVANSSTANDAKKRRLHKMMLKTDISSKTDYNRVKLESNPIGTSVPTAREEESRSLQLHNVVSMKLQSAQFRFLNEQLYTRDSKAAKKLFATEPKSFFAYHAGFLQQVSKWPINPLDLIIAFLKKRPHHWIIGDFGCGDARLAASVKNKVHSFDLVAINERVTEADISNVPLPDESLNAAVFCLSLMGTNYIDFLLEANRTLKNKGVLLIAEVTSRFQSVPKFLNLMKKLGFELKHQDRRNTHFFLFDFIKVKPPQADFQRPLNLLKPCVYKRR